MTDPRLEISDPATLPARLAELAQQHPEYGQYIAAHPNAYPELQAWIAQYAAAPAAAVQPLATTQPLAATQPLFATQPLAAAQPPSAMPQAYGAAAQPPAAGAGTRKGKPKKAMMISLASVLALLLATGGGLWWFFGAKLGGAASSEAAAMKLVNGIASMDPLSVYGALAPSEFSPFADTVKKLSTVSKDGSTDNVDSLLDDLTSEVTITATDIITESEPITPEVERVVFTGGKIVIDGEENAVGRALAGLYRLVLPTDMMGVDQEQVIRDSLDLPYTVDLGEIASDARNSSSGLKGISIVSVKESGGWYFSPLLTIADLTYLDNFDVDEQFLGSFVWQASPSDTPEEAMTAWVDAVRGDAIVGYSFNAGTIARQLPLPERRLLSIYGPVVESMLDIEKLLPQSEWQPTVVESKYSSSIDGDQARITVEAFELSGSRTEGGRELVNSWRVENLCVEGSNEWLEEHPKSYFSGGQWRSEWTKEVSTWKTCLTDFPLAREFGYDEFAVVAVKENGGWLVSPLTTYADMTAIVTERYITLSENGELEGLLRRTYGY